MSKTTESQAKFGGILVSAFGECAESGINSELRLRVSELDLKPLILALSSERAQKVRIYFEDLFVMNNERDLDLYIRWVDIEKPGSALCVVTKAKLPHGTKKASFPAVSPYWPSARCAEVEAEVLFGVDFEGPRINHVGFTLGDGTQQSSFPMRKTPS